MNKSQNKSPIEVLKSNFIPFAKYVLQTRSTPNLDDNIKTGARYILWTFIKNKYVDYNVGVQITGQVMNYNPHGDASIWGNICHLASKYLCRYPLLQGEGNTGSSSKGYDFAAPRYLKLKINKKMKDLILPSTDLVEDWTWNYIETEKIPVSLPSYFPLFINGWLGIGVGMASALPSFNLKEVIEKSRKYLENTSITNEELICMPDFATGCDIVNREEIFQSLLNGEGKAVKMKARYEIIGGNVVKFTNFPHSVFPTRIMGELETLENEEKIPAIKKYTDTSSKDGSVTVEFEKSISPLQLEREINFLYKNTSLIDYSSINCNMLTDNRRPEKYTFPTIVKEYVEKVKRLKQKEYYLLLKKLETKLEINEGFLRIIDNIDQIIFALKNDWSKEQIMEIYPFTDLQLEKLLEFKLKQLKKLEKQKIENEMEETKKQIEEVKNIINSEDLIKKEVNKVFDLIIKQFGDERRSNIIKEQETLNNVKVYEKKDYTISIMEDKKILITEGFELAKKRNSRGKKSNIISKIEVTNLDILLVFEKDEVTPLTVENLENKENIDYICKANKEDDIIIVTKKYIKRTKISEYIKGKKKKALNLQEDDKIIFISTINGNETIALTDGSNITTVKVADIKATGKTAKGVIAMKNEVVSACLSGEELVIVTKNNIKRINMEEIPQASRPSKGVKSGEDIIYITSKKKLFLKDKTNATIINTEDIPIVSRNASGLKKGASYANGI